MPTPTANISGNIDAAVGEVLGIQATVRYSDAVWADETNNTVIVGGGVIPIGADGAVDVDLPQTTDAIRVGIELSYVDNATRQRTKLWSGWRELTADTTFAEFWAFTPETPPLTDGERIAADLDDLDTRVGVLETDSGGEVDPTLEARIDGYIDHGDVSGAVTFNGPTGSHWFDATAPTTVTLDGYTEGQVATLICFTGAADVTVENAGDAQLADGTAWSAVLARGSWVSGGGGASGPTPVAATAPTADDTANTYTIPAVTGVVYKVGGVTRDAGSYSVSNTNSTVVVTAEAAPGYTLAGTDSWTLNFTFAVAWADLVYDTMSGTNGTEMNGRAPDTTGAGTWLRNNATLSTSTIDTNRLKFVSSGGGQGAGFSINPAPGGANPTAARATFGYAGAGASNNGVSCGVRYQSSNYGPQTVNYEIAGGEIKVGATGVDQTASALTPVAGKSLTGHPASGVFQVEIIGTSVKVYIDSTLIATGSIAGPTLLAQTCSFGISTNATVYVDSYRMEIAS